MARLRTASIWRSARMSLQELGRRERMERRWATFAEYSRGEVLGTERQDSMRPFITTVGEAVVQRRDMRGWVWGEPCGLKKRGRRRDVSSPHILLEWSGVEWSGVEWKGSGERERGAQVQEKRGTQKSSVRSKSVR